MPAWLSISLLLGGTAVAIRAIVAVRRVAHAGRQRSHEKRLERDAKRAIRARMHTNGKAAEASRAPAAHSTDARPEEPRTPIYAARNEDDRHSDSRSNRRLAAPDRR